MSDADDLLSTNLAIPSQILRSANAVVHLESEAEPLEASDYAAEEDWTRFVCISDTHAQTFRVPDGDVLLHSGDLTGWGSFGDFEKTVEWLCELPHRVKIVIAGNHDLPLDRTWYAAKGVGWHDIPEDYDKIIDLFRGERARKAGLVYLQNESYTFSLGPGRREWSVYGSPWSPWFFNLAFNYESNAAEELISSFPNTDILLTHGPPACVFDYTTTGQFVGCPVLASHLSSGRLRPRLHVFGHIHEAHGAYIHPWDSGDAPSTAALAQNRFFEVDSEEDTDGKAKEMRDKLEEVRTYLEDRNVKESVQRTVFVNAANEPSLPNVVENGRSVSRHGGPGVQPIVVDLKD